MHEPRTVKTGPVLERAPHTGPTLTTLGTGLTGSRPRKDSQRAGPTGNRIHREQGSRYEPPWQSCIERPHLPRGVAQPPLPHMIATKARAGQCPTPLPDRHARASTTTPRHLPTPGHPWSSCSGRSPVPRAVARDPVQPRIATAAELSHCPRLSSWRGPLSSWRGH